MTRSRLSRYLIRARTGVSCDLGVRQLPVTFPRQHGIPMAAGFWGEPVENMRKADLRLGIPDAGIYSGTLVSLLAVSGLGYRHEYGSPNWVFPAQMDTAGRVNSRWLQAPATKIQVFPGPDYGALFVWSGAQRTIRWLGLKLLLQQAARSVTRQVRISSMCTRTY